MKFAQFCIKHRVTTILAYILIAVFGVVSFSSMPLALMPSMEIPMAVVYATYPNAGPEEVESMVTKTLEGACASVSGVEELQSTSAENISMVMVSFADGTDLAEALVDLREKIDQIKPALPDDASSPTVMSIDIDSMPVVEIGLRGADLAQLQGLAEDTVSPSLERIDGVASVDIVGGYDKEIAITTDANRLAGYNMTVAYISQILAAENISVPGGDVVNGTQTMTARTDGEFTSVEDISNTLIPLPTGGTVRLGEVAEVKEAISDRDAIAKIGNEECIILSVNKQSGTNTVEVANKAIASFEKLMGENPNLRYTVLMNQSDYINMTVNNTIQNILFGVLFAALVIFVFLRDFRATLVISLSMPLCIIAVFLMMKALNITMNMMSLGGLAMGVGMIVDNSIVVLENIFSFRADGQSRFDSCVQGTGEVALSIIASTLTTCAVFLPIGLSGGMAGMMFKEFSVTICALMLASLVIALTLVPLMCYILLDAKEKKHSIIPNNKGDQADRPLTRIYKKLLKFFVTRRAVAMLISLGLVVVFVGSIALCGFELIPEMDQGTISISVGMPNGSTDEDKGAMCDRITEIVLENVPELDYIYYSTGSSTSMMSSASSAGVTLELVDLKDRERSVQEIGAELRTKLQDLAGAELTVSTAGQMDMSSMSGSPIQVQLSGDDYDQLIATGEQLIQKIRAIPDATDVESSASDQVSRINISVNRENAARFGLNAATIGTTVRAQLNGSSATTLKVGGDEIDVSVKGDSRVAESLDALRTMPIATASGGSVPLELVASVTVELAPQSIARDNQSRTITITGDSLSDDTTGIATAVTAVVNDFTFPDGITADTGGEMEEMIESFTTLAKALGVGVLLVYFILASQFESFVMPIIIMAILPVGLFGSLFGLPMTGHKISMVAFIGVIMLSGTIVNSSIVLIDYIKTRRGRGEDKTTAILNACPRRVRPVLMTTLTTVLGLLPMAFSGGEGSEMMRPMAIVMITGMIVSTIVTLLFTPVYYSVIDSITDRPAARAKREAKKQAKLARKEQKQLAKPTQEEKQDR